MKVIQLYNNDCFNILPTIKDNSIDLILCDLPYGIFEDGAGGNWHRGEELQSWDKPLDLDRLFKEYKRVLKNYGRCVLFCQGLFVRDLLNQDSDVMNFSQKLIWKKNISGSILGVKQQFIGYYEDIVVFTKRQEDNQQNIFMGDILKAEIESNGHTVKDCYDLLGYTVNHYFSKGKQYRAPTKEKWGILEKNGFIKNLKYEDFIALRKVPESRQATFNLLEGENQKKNILEFSKDLDGYHPTQKPVALLEYLIKTYSNEGELVLDNTMGSGSTGVACINTNRSFIGIEKNKDYFNCTIARMKCISRDKVGFIEIFEN